jgi:hypothetical protein
MLISFLLRLNPQALGEARIAGWAEVVETGVTAPISSADDLIAFLHQQRPSVAAGAPADSDEGAGGQPDG